MNEIQIYSRPKPFSNAQMNYTLPAGTTIEAAVKVVMPIEIENIGATVFINGHKIPRKHWHRVKPKAGTITNIMIAPQGGKGKKNPLVSLLSIAVMFAAPYVAGFVTAQFIAATGIYSLTAAQIVYGLAYVATSVVGKLLASALSPPPKPSNAGIASNPAESPTQFIEGAKNSINPFGVIPICLGTNRMFPLQAARVYTETQDSDQYVRQLFTYGYATKITLDQLKIGETLVSEFTDFDFIHKLDGDLHEPTELYSNDVYQDDLNVLVSKAAGYIVRTTQLETNEAVVDFTFPRGLAEFKSNGNRVARTVVLELQYAASGSGDWSPGALFYKSLAAQNLTVADGTTNSSLIYDGGYYYEGYRRDLVVLDSITGVAAIVKGTAVASTANGATPPPLPSGKIRLSTLLVRARQAQSYAAPVTTSLISKTDDRAASLFGNEFQNAGDFLVSNSSLTITVAAGNLKTNQLEIKESQTEALRKSVRITFPSAGLYDIRVQRISDDTNSDQIFDQAYLTAIKSIKYQAPVNLPGLCGTAVRIKATDQLNGALDQLNALVSNLIPDYDATIGEWVVRQTSNPASIYRYVLQGPANARPLTDDQIILSDIEAWHTHCVQQNYTYNRVIDYETTVDEVKRDVASAGSATPSIVDGKHTIAIDKLKDEITQMVTPRNSWGYSAELTFPKLPHAFRVQFRNKDKGYQQDERIVYDDGYNEGNATEFESLELQSCTDSNLAFKAARRYLASVRLRPETHTFNLDVENLSALRGDRIKLAHDVPIIGVGDGRIKSITDDGGSPAMITAVTLDDIVQIPNNSTYYMRIRRDDGTQLYKQLLTMPGEFYTFQFAEPFPVSDNVQPDDLVYVVEAGGELDLVITKIEPQDDLTARVTAVNYAPEVFDAENSTIPPFESNITTPLEFIRPLPPVLVSEQSDEGVMIRNSDGSFTPRAVFVLRNDNEGSILTTVKVRPTGTDTFSNVAVLESSPDRLVITGLQDGTSYDIFIRYRRAGSSMQSLPLQLNNYKFIGASGTPADVTGFLITVSGDTALFKWNANEEIDIDHYEIRFSRQFTSATWEASQVLDDRIYENRLSVPFQGGTYLIKAVDYQGNVSENATAVITYDPGLIRNAVETLVEHPTFNGYKFNVIKSGTAIVMASTTQDGYYYFDETVDLGSVFTSYITANIIANGAFVNNIFDMDDIFAEGDIFGSGNNNIFAMDDLFAQDDIFGIGTGGWAVELQYRTSNDPQPDQELLFENDFTNAAWTKSALSVSPGAAVSVRGGFNASKLVESATTANHAITQVITASPAQNITFEGFFQKAERSQVQVRIRNAGATANYVRAQFNLLNGTVQVSDASGNGQLVTAYMEDFGNGIYKCVLVGQPDTSGTSVDAQIYLRNSTGTTTSYAGDGTSGIYASDLHLYQGELPNFSAWQTFVTGNVEFETIQARLKMSSLTTNVSPLVSELALTIDMPDRIERGDDLTVSAAGVTISYDPPFKGNPAVVITIQDGDATDEIQFLAKSPSGFTFKVYNQTTATYVERMYDFVASGYGRES